MGVGALALIIGLAILVIGVLLLFIGVGAGLAGAMAYAPILYVAQVIVGAWLGNKILGEIPGGTGTVTSSAVGRVALGLLILRGAELVPVLGWFVWLAVLLWGTGAILLGFFRVSRAESLPFPA